MKVLSVSRMWRLGSVVALGTVFGGACSVSSLAALTLQELGGVSGLINQALTLLGGLNGGMMTPAG